MSRAAVASLITLVAAAIALASCGGSDARLLPGKTARDITANLDSVKQLVDEGDCLAAESAAQQVSEQIEGLGNVDRKLKEALQEGAARLEEVVASCEEPAEAAPPPTLSTEAEATEKPEKPPKKKEPKGEEAATPALPPQAKGKAKGHEKGNEPSEEEAVSPSGGVGPSTPVGEGE